MGTTAFWRLINFKLANARLFLLVKGRPPENSSYQGLKPGFHIITTIAVIIVIAKKLTQRLQRSYGNRELSDRSDRYAELIFLSDHNDHSDSSDSSDYVETSLNNYVGNLIYAINCPGSLTYP